MTRLSLSELLAAFPGRRVLVLGDVMLDEYIWGEVRRISPEAPVPVVEVRRRSFVPGGAANTAANVAALGGRPVLVSVVGRDHAAATLRDVLAQGGTDPDGLCADPARCTTSKSRIVAHNQQVARLDVEERARCPSPWRTPCWPPSGGTCRGPRRASSPTTPRGSSRPGCRAS